jgi:HSP90 family molecular chaperone
LVTADAVRRGFSSDSKEAAAPFSADAASTSTPAAGGDAASDAEFERVMADLTERMGQQQGGDAAADGGKAPSMEELMAQMEKMGIKMDNTGIGAADRAAGVGSGGWGSDEGIAAAEKARQEAEAAATAKFEVKPKGQAASHTFQTQTKEILDIMANSLYSDHEVFLRELISNASDALEKLRFLRNATAGSTATPTAPSQRELAIRIHTNEAQNLLVIEDNGIGMTAEELQSHLGVIARSGSKAWVKDLASKGGKDGSNNIIGQFGVGFYSVFMVAERIDVISQSSKLDPATGQRYPAHLWSSDGSGSYDLTPIEAPAETGTTLKIHLKSKFKEFAQAHTLTTVIQKYSSFVGFPIELNGAKINTHGAVWLESKDSVTPEQHTAFYRYMAQAYDTPTYTLHFHVDAPLALHGLFYFPERHMEKYGMGRMEPGASLYSRKVLIKSRSKDVLPEWLRFVRGVADSEDIPLNISRENMQDSRLIQKIQNILVKKILRFLEDEAKANPAKYNKCQWNQKFTAR